MGVALLWLAAVMALAQPGKLGPDITCQANGCLRALQMVGSFRKAALQPYAEPGVTIDNGYVIYRIRYFTNGREALATVTIPYDAGLAAPPGGWHIVANNHGTIGIEDPCTVGAGPAGVGLAGYFGARGFIGVTPDYPGLGTPGLHTYLDKQSEGAASLDALRATRALAATLSIPTSGRFAVAGLSQGGHAALSAAALKTFYAPELDIRAYAVSAPASAWEEHWSLASQHQGWHIGVQAMLFYSWSRAYGWKNLPLWTDTMAKSVDDIMTRLCVVSATGAVLVTSVPQDAALVFHPDFLAEYRSRTWKRYAAVHDAFEKNAIRGFTQSAPVRIYQGDKDALVPEAATRQMVETLRLNGVIVDYVVVPGGEHTNVAFHFLAMKQLKTDDAIGWIRGLLGKP